MKRDYDRGATSLKPLMSGDVVRVQRKWGCDPAIAQYTHENPRSYEVRHEGGELRRNRRHLRITREQLPLFLPELDDPCTGVAAQPSRRVVVQPLSGVVAQPPPGVVAQSASPSGVVAQPPPGVAAQPPPEVVAEPSRRAVHPSEQTQRYSGYGRMITKSNRFGC